MGFAWSVGVGTGLVVFITSALSLGTAACSDQGSGDGLGGAAGGPPESTGGAPPTDPDNLLPEGPRSGPLLTADCPLPDPVEGGSGEVCCGCLCASERWSCTEDTCVDDLGLVQELDPEAGYIEVPGGDYTGIDYLGATEWRTSPTHRVFYSFHPADSSPEERPLAVFFNGGPGAATTSVLMALNTGPHTMDPERTGDADITENEHSFTRAFNLLYVDAPMTGFSYALPLDSGEEPPLVLDPDREAGMVNQVLLFFLGRHPALEDNRVVLIGESYGGLRAGQMLRQLLSPETLLEEGSPYGDQSLYCALKEHMRRDDPADAPRQIEVADIAAQFGHVGLIQPLLAGFVQDTQSMFDDSLCVADYEPYQCDEPLGHNDEISAELARRLLVPENLESMLGTDPTTIAWLDPALRHPPYTFDGESEVFVSIAALERIGRDIFFDSSMGAEFLLLMPYLEKALITRAALDRVVDSYGLVGAAREWGLMPEDMPDQPADAERPGLVDIEIYGAGVGTLRMPIYETAGHAVTQRQPEEFFDDLVEWLGD